VKHHHYHHIRLINDLSTASITQHKTHNNIQWQWRNGNIKKQMLYY